MRFLLLALALRGMDYPPASPLAVPRARLTKARFLARSSNIGDGLAALTKTLGRYPMYVDLLVRDYETGRVLFGSDMSRAQPMDESSNCGLALNEATRKSLCREFKVPSLR